MREFGTGRSLALGIGLSVALAFSSAPNAGSQGPPVALTCEQDEQVIFSSSSTDIAAFDASQYGAILVQVVLIIEENVNLYIFSPGRVYCSIPADLDTSSVNL